MPHALTRIMTTKTSVSLVGAISIAFAIGLVLGRDPNSSPTGTADPDAAAVDRLRWTVDRHEHRFMILFDVEGPQAKKTDFVFRTTLERARECRDGLIRESASGKVQYSKVRIVAFEEIE